MDDALFRERLDTFIDKTICDLEAFAEREGRPVEEIKRLVAEWHCKQLFHVERGTDSTQQLLRDALQRTSEVLSSLQEIAGLHSFFLVVDPQSPTNEGFLGGTLQGREFWRGHRGCGTAGAQAFKVQCLKNARAPSSITPAPILPLQPIATGVVSRKQTPANQVKAEVYANVRLALRAASGIRNAEMKWSNHANLSTYGVHLVGWPAGVPMANPSSLSVLQNRRILEALAEGRMRFLNLNPQSGPPESLLTEVTTPSAEANYTLEGSIDFSSWACDEDDADTPTRSPAAEISGQAETHDSVGHAGPTPDDVESPSSKKHRDISPT